MIATDDDATKKQTWSMTQKMFLIHYDTLCTKITLRFSHSLEPWKWKTPSRNPMEIRTVLFSISSTMGGIEITEKRARKQ